MSGPPSAPSRPHTHGIDLDVDGKDGVGTGGVLIHQGVANGSVLPARLHDAFALSHVVYRVHGQPLDIHPLLGMLLQLQGGGPGKAEVTKGRTLSRPTGVLLRHPITGRGLPLPPTGSRILGW